MIAQSKIHEANALKVFSSIFLGFLWSGSLAASEPLTMQQIISRYLEVSPRLQSQRQTELASHYAVKEAAGTAFPDISLVSSFQAQKYPEFQRIPNIFPGSSDFQPDQTYSVHLRLEQPVYMGGQIRKAYQLRRQQYRLSQWESREVVRTSLPQVLQAFLQLAFLQRQLELQQESQGFQKEFVRLTRARQHRGNILDYELHQAEAGLLAYSPRIEDIKLQLENLRRQLAVDLQMAEENIEFELPVADAALFKLDNSLEEDFKLALSHRPDYQIARNQVAMQDTQKFLALGPHLPSVSLMAQWGYQNPETAQLFESESVNSLIAVNLKIPLFSGLTSLQAYRESVASKAAAESQAEVLHRKIRAEVKNARVNLEVSAQRVQQTKAWYEKAEKALLTARKSFRLGLIGNFQIVQLQLGRETAASGYFESILKFQLAKIEWSKVLGADMSRYSPVNPLQFQQGFLE